MSQLVFRFPRTLTMKELKLFTKSENNRRFYLVNISSLNNSISLTLSSFDTYAFPKLLFGDIRLRIGSVCPQRRGEISTKKNPGSISATPHPRPPRS